MRIRTRVPAVLVAGLLAAVAVHAADGPQAAVHACLLAAGLVAGELLVLRLEDGTGVPLSYAPLIAIAVGFEPDAALVIVCGAQLVAWLLRVDGRSVAQRGLTFVQRLAVGAAAVGAARATWNLLDRRETLAAVLVTIGATIAAAMIVDEIARRAQRLRSATTARGLRAWSALGATGALMALGYRGVDGDGRSGLWSLALFAIPLVAAWYSFERLAAVSRTHRQTLRALSMATELAGFVRDGHGERVAVLCERIAGELGLVPSEIDDLVAAAYLHHLGVVTIDEVMPLDAAVPIISGGQAGPVGPGPESVAIVATVTSAMLADIPALAAAGAIVGGQPLPSRRPGDATGEHRLTSQVLKVASDFDDLASGERSGAAFALEALYSSPGYVYDRRVLEALERVVASAD